jgi:SM-20-related protein
MTADYSAIGAALRGAGWCRCEAFLPPQLTAALRKELVQRQAALAPAGIGRATVQQLAPAVRADSTLWLDGDSPAQRNLFEQLETLRHALNRQLLLGLFDLEAHYACYAPGAYYERHLDAFRDGDNDSPRRILSMVLYLNESWRAQDGGELVLYDGVHNELARFAPESGSAVFFLSAEFPHAVLPTAATRLSIAGWFRDRPMANAR